MQIPVSLLREIEDKNPLPVDKIDERKNEVTSKPAIELDGPDRFHKRREMLANVAPEDFDEAFERYVGGNDLLPINYLQIGYLRSKAVGRIVYFDLLEGKPAVATGFLISPDLVMTNCHVFTRTADFRDAKIEFNYQYDIQGLEASRIVFELSPEKFFHSKADLDFCLIGVKDMDVTGTHSIKERGYLILNGTLGKAGKGDYAAIIQHPEGKLMQIAIRENKILDDSLASSLIYNSDTARGSSGSGVFNDQWQLIALHSAGVAKKNAAGQYLDRDNNIIEEVNGRVDSARIEWLSNRGIRISAIWKYLFERPELATNPYILMLSSPMYSDGRQLSFLALPENGRPDGAENLPLAAPAAIAPPAIPTPPITINISIGQKGIQLTTDTVSPPVTAGAASLVPGLEFEKKIEDEIDFSTCKGFDEYFLGDQTPLPKLSTSLKNKVAYYVDNPNLYVLKYHHFSAVQHAVRRQPVYSAINIWGKRRYEELTGRSDTWYRDRRIDFDAQLDDDYYYKSRMDRGHMVRREDAEWGYSMPFAKQAAEMTCVYTNACPQVPALNRDRYGYHGEWGKLEGDVLEHGVQHETGPEAKICVYNGPVFDAEDPVYKNIQVPLRYWKLIVWRKPDGSLNTTAFMLSQEELVGEVDFEELHYDDIFKARQCPVSEIEQLTGLTFPLIRDWDTFQGNGQ